MARHVSATLGSQGHSGRPEYRRYEPETLRYSAPERVSFEAGTIFVDDPSKESDVYSLTMTSNLLSMYPFWKPPYYLRQLTSCDQVLTGVLPYHGTNEENMLARIHAGERPSRPKNPRWNRRLQRPVWDVITTGWSHKPDERCELSVMHHVFSTHTKPGDLNTQYDRNPMITETSQTLK